MLLQIEGCLFLIICMQSASEQLTSSKQHCAVPIRLQTTVLMRSFSHWARKGPKFRAFFSLSRRKIRSFLPSLGVFWWNFGGVLSVGALKCARLEFSGCRVKPRPTFGASSQNRRQFHPRHFHPKTGSSIDTFIQKWFRPMTCSSKTGFIQ